MGILDMLTSVLAARSAEGLDKSLIPIVLKEVLGNGEQGGLSAIVEKMKQAGFGEIAKSWVDTGENMPISAQQLQDLLGNDTVRQIATRFGIPVDQLSTVLAQVLPAAVDGASPNGTLPPKA